MPPAPRGELRVGAHGGDARDSGPSGGAGPVGANGAAGAGGVTGSAGATGAQGASGPQGVTGSGGASGAQGATGSAGATGSGGATGPQGAGGPAGATGPEGPAGFSSPSAEFYALMPTDNESTVAPGAAVELPYTLHGRATADTPISGEALLATSVPDVAIEVVNPAANPAALTITPKAGGTQPDVASLVIQQLN